MITPVAHPPQRSQAVIRHLLDAAYHSVMAVTDFEEKFEVDRTDFWTLLSNSASLNASEKKRIADSLPKLSKFQVTELCRIFKEEADKLGKYLGDPSSKTWAFFAFRRENPTYDDLPDAGFDIPELIEDNLNNWTVVAEILDIPGLPDAIRAESYRRMFDGGCRDAGFLNTYVYYLYHVCADMDATERVLRSGLTAGADAMLLGNFAVFMERVRKDMDEAEKLYRAAEAAGASANTLGSFALFMQTVRQDMAEADRLYRAAEAAGADGKILGNFALFMKNTRQDMAEAERLYRAAEAAGAGANVLGNFALFTHTVRKDMDEAERLYRAAEAGGAGGNVLGNFALFMETVRQDMAEAERLYRAAEAAGAGAAALSNFAYFTQVFRKNAGEAERLYRLALESDRNHANSHGNFASLLISVGREAEADAHASAALAHASVTQDDLRLECWFYRHAVFPEWREEAEGRIGELIRAGVRSPGWDLSGVIARAEALGHPDPDWLRRVAAVIADGADPAGLDLPG